MFRMQQVLEDRLPEIFAETCISLSGRIKWRKIPVPSVSHGRPERSHAAIPDGMVPVMLIFPAIDLRGGHCVRLRQGDYAQETVFGADPIAVARRWVQQGASWLHLVDLDGARQGQPVNGSVIQQIVQATGVPCQV